MSENEQPTPLEFLRSIYSDEGVPLPVRMKAAIEAAPYVHPKLSVVANITSFAAEMKELARQRYAGGNVIDASRSAIPKTPAATPHEEQ